MRYFDKAALRKRSILFVEGRDGPANRNRLCVKGRFGLDYTHHPHRLTKPLIRRDGVAKDQNLQLNDGNWSEVFREATWEEALARAAGGLKQIRENKGPQALAGFGSAKGTNEEAYLFQKLVRTGFGTNNVDRSPAPLYHLVSQANRRRRRFRLLGICPNCSPAAALPLEALRGGSRLR